MLSSVPDKGLLFTYKETTVFRAVVLLSIISAISLFLSINLSVMLSDFYDKDGKKIDHAFNFPKIFLSLMICFLSSFVGYYIVVYTFGFGSSLVASSN